MNSPLPLAERRKHAEIEALRARNRLAKLRDDLRVQPATETPDIGTEMPVDGDAEKAGG